LYGKRNGGIMTLIYKVTKVIPSGFRDEEQVIGYYSNKTDAIKKSKQIDEEKFVHSYIEEIELK
jgi:hypothetical protein